MGAPSAPLAATWPLVGREAELAGIARARGEAGCTGVVLSAGAGMGKSRLAREAHAAAERDGALVDWIQATTSAAAVPLGAFAGLIPDDVRSDDALELMRRSTDALRERAGGRRFVLGLDDAQLLDPVSAALVLHLTVTGSAFVVATVRSGEPCPDAITSLWKDAGARRMELVRLSDAAVARLVESALGGPVEQSALRWLVDSSQGNALYLRELVLAGVEAGSLARSRGLWRLSRRPAMSRTLAELVAARMGGLSAAVRAPVELLAVGEPLRLAEVSALSDFGALVEAEGQGLVVVDPAGEEVRLAHPLYGEVLCAELPVLRGRQLRLQVAEALEAREPLTPADALRVARLRLDAGAPIPPGLLLDAARAATLAGDPELGAELGRSALADGGGLPAALVLARAHAARKHFEQAEEVLAAVAGEVGPDDAGVEYLEQRTQALFWGLDRPRETSELLAAARGWSADRAWQRRLRPLELAYAAVLEGYEESVRTLGEVLEDPELDAETRRRTERRLAVSLFFSGRAREAHALNARLLPSIPLRGYSDAMALGLWRLLGKETGQDLDGLEESMRATLQEAVRANDQEAAGHAAFSVGYTHYLAGRFRDAARWYDEAELHFELQDTFGTLLHVHALRVGVDLLAGDVDGAAAAYERLQTALGGRAPLSSQAPYVARAEGWAARLRSDAEGARVLLERAAGLAPDMPGYAAQLAYEALRAGAGASGVATALQPLLERCDAPLVTAYGDHARALAARDGAALLEAAETLAALGALRYGMEAAVHAAEVHAAAGREDSARRAATRARELFATGHGAEFPAIEGLDAAATGLTRREAQVAALAGRGLSNAEIADQLVLSVRTVETHVYRAMQKRGVSDRRQL